MATKVSSIPTSTRALLQPDPLSTKLVLAQLPVLKISPGSDAHLLRVHTVALCNGELLWPRNFPQMLNIPGKRLVPGFDVAGTVVEAPESSPFRIGDEVYARTKPARTGCAQDYAVAITKELAHRSPKLSWAESAAVPLSSQTAWQALFKHGGIPEIGAAQAGGKRVLVTGASGGVGSWVVQLANLAGAAVVGTCSLANFEMVRGLGAAEVLDYRATNFREWGRNAQNQADLVIDCIGQKALEDAWWTVRDGGSLISIFQPPEQAKPADFDRKDVKNEFFIMEPDGKELEKITDLINDGKCRPFVDSVWHLEDHEEAFKRADSGHALGKVILDLTAST